MAEESILRAGWLRSRLQEALGNSDATVRARAAEALGDLAEEALECVPALARVSLEDKDSGVRAAAVTALARIGASPEALLDNAVALLDHADETVRARAGWAIGKLEPSLAERAIPALGERVSTDPAVDGKFGAVWALGRIRSSDPEAIDILTRALADENGDIRAEAARSLGRSGTPASSALPALVLLLQDSDPLAREQAAKAVGRLGAEAPEVVEALATLTGDPLDYVRAAAAEALARLGEVAGSPSPCDEEDSWVAQAPGVDELARRLAEADDFGRAEAPWLIGKLDRRVGEMFTEQLVVQAVIDRDSDARWSALNCLARAAKRSPEVTSAVARVLETDRDPDVRQGAAVALGVLWHEAPHRALSALAAAVHDEDALVREDAVEALGAMRPAADVGREALEQALADPHGGVRARAAESLAAIDASVAAR
jgi:HEAT repeat protein